MNMRLILTALALCISFTGVTSAQELPALTSHVNDYASVLKPYQVQALEAKLASFETETGNQVVILTVQSLGGDTIENYANKVYKAWKLGEKKRNNGALLVNAIDNRKIRIEVGYGLEGALPDARAKDIILDVTPMLKANDLYGAYTQATDKIVLATKGEYKSTHSASGSKNKADALGSLLFFGFVILFFFSGMAGMLHPIFGGTVGAGGTWWLLWLMDASDLVAFTFAGVGFLVGMVAKFVLENMGEGSSSSGSYGSSWGSSSSSGSSSSYSGGGGDSGGGGASGDY